MSAEAAAAAERHFYAGDYTSCLLVLANLRRLDETDPKVQHNSALAKFTAEGGTNTERLLESLLAAKTQLEERARASAAAQQARVAGAGAAGGEAGAGAAGGAAAQPPLTEESDCALPALNAAVVLWQTGHRAAAVALAEPLWAAVDALPPPAVLRLTLLLLDAHAEAGAPDRMLRAMARLERAAGGAPELPLLLHVGRARAHLLAGSPKAARRELKGANEAAAALAAASGGLPSAPAWLASLQLQFVKAQMELARGCCAGAGKATRLLAAAAASLAAAAPSAALAAQARAPQVGACFAAAGGAVLHAAGRHACAAAAYAEALRASGEARALPPGGSAVAVASQAQRDELQYSLGLQQLLCGQWEAAASSLQLAAPAFARSRPAFWLRLAECCLGAVRCAAEAAADAHAVRAVAGEAPFRQLLLARRAPVRREAGAGAPPEAHPEADLGAAGGARALTPAYAALCLQNAEALLALQVAAPSPQPPPGLAGAEADAAAAAAERRAAAAAEERRRTLTAVLAARAWLCLQRGVARLALADAAALLAQAPPAEARLLARAYAAEALLMLDRPAEAVEHLSSCLVERDEAEAERREGVGGGGGPGAEEDEGEGGAEPLPLAGAASLEALRGDAARAALQVNLAGVFAQQGELAAAHACACAALQLQPASLLALLSLVFVELRRGNAAQALALLRGQLAPSPRAGPAAAPRA